jgi:RNA 3'-terminal phosphate cyclase (ATP)
MLEINGSAGEGGGQILRTAITLSVCTGRAIRVRNVRSGRRKPGLRPQHLAAVRAAAELSAARVAGDAVGSRELSFAPGRLRPGDYRFATGTAGSAMLVLQTVLPALATARSTSRLVFEGGTHVPLAPTYEFVERAYLPLIRRMGPGCRMTLERPGFYPRGGGRVTLEIAPVPVLSSITLEERGAVRDLGAEILMSRLPAHIAEREARVLRERLPLDTVSIRQPGVTESSSPGNVVTVTCRSDALTVVAARVGRRGVPAEQVAGEVADDMEQYIASGVPVDVHLADQLLVPFALAGGGSFVTSAPSPHTLTNLDVIRQFPGFPALVTEPEPGARWRVAFGGT